MPILRLKEIRDLSSEDRVARLEDFRTELVRLKTMIGAGGTIENTARVRQLRKVIAKILTIEHEEKLEANRPKPKPKKPEAKKNERKKTETKKTEAKKAETEKTETKKRRKKKETKEETE